MIKKRPLLVALLAILVVIAAVRFISWNASPQNELIEA